MCYACQVLGGIEKQCCTRAEQTARTGCDDGAVLEFDCRRSKSGELFALAGCHCGASILGRELCLLHQQGYLLHLVLVVATFGKAVKGCVVAAYYLIAGGIAANIFVAHAEAYHIHAHIGGRLIWILAVHAFENGIEHGENLDIAIVVHCYLAISFKVEGVDHIHIVEVGCSGFVCHIHGVLERQAPHREGLKLGIACLYAALMLVIELAQTHCHLAAAGTRGGHHHKRANGLGIIVLAEAFVGVDEFHIIGIAVDGVVIAHFYAHALQAGSIGIGTFLSVVVGDYHIAGEQAYFLKLAAQSKHIFVVGDAQVAAHLVFLYIEGADYYYHLGVVAQLHEHAQLTVGVKTGQHAAGVIVVKQLTSKLEV